MANKGKKGHRVVLEPKGEKSEGRKSKAKKAEVREKVNKGAAVKQKPRWTQPCWIGSMVGGIAAVCLIIAGVIWGPALFSTGKEAPQVISFTMASETVAEDECPVFNFEVANCSAITITQDGEIITEVEITVPPGTPAAFLQPRHGEAYALTETQPGVETHYCPGVYPVIYKGCSSGRPATIMWKFEGTGTEKGGSAVLAVRSLDGQVVKKELAYNIVPPSERPIDKRPVITAPDCAEQDASSTVKPLIDYFGVENPKEMVEEGWQPKFKFSADNASMVKIEQGDDGVVFVIAVIVLIVRERRTVHQPRQGEAYALTENQPGVEPRYCPGIYPAGFNGGTNGKPSKNIWKFGDENEPEPFATITVCSPGGDVLTDILPFFVRCTGDCVCVTEAEAKTRGYDTKCSKVLCGYDSTQPPIDGYPKKYCFKQCPVGCECLTQAEVEGLGYNAKKCDPNEQPCTKIVPPPDLSLKSTKDVQQTAGPTQVTPAGTVVQGYCYRVCPEGCDCLTMSEGQQRGCGVYSGPAWVPSTCECTSEACGIDEGELLMHCCPKLPVVRCSLSSTSLPPGGGYIDVSWASENADGVTLSIGSATPGQVSLNDSLGASVTKDTCFTFTAKNKCGMTSTVECCVDVEPPPPPPPVPGPQPHPAPSPAPPPAPPCLPEEPAPPPAPPPAG